KSVPAMTGYRGNSERRGRESIVVRRNNLPSEAHRGKLPTDHPAGLRSLYCSRAAAAPESPARKCREGGTNTASPAGKAPLRISPTSTPSPPQKPPTLFLPQLPPHLLHRPLRLPAPTIRRHSRRFFLDIAFEHRQKTPPRLPPRQRKRLRRNRQ